MEAVLKGNFKAPSPFIKKLERSYTSNLTAHMKGIERKKQIHIRGVEGKV